MLVLFYPKARTVNRFLCAHRLQLIDIDCWNIHLRTMRGEKLYLTMFKLEAEAKTTKPHINVPPKKTFYWF